MKTAAALVFGRGEKTVRALGPEPVQVRTWEQRHFHPRDAAQNREAAHNTDRRLLQRDFEIAPLRSRHLVDFIDQVDAAGSSKEQQDGGKLH
ncbi:MAG: hypothetical protein M1436_05470 [Acidobacteria bacterium]|nr:hypothetical protein [Acidobacteriota bacterium]